MKPKITLNIGRESTDKEIDEILSAFSPYYEVEINKSIIRLSEDWLPLIIEFTIAAVGGGLIYDGLKEALKSLQNKFKLKKLDRSPAVSIRFKSRTYILSDEEIKLQSIDIDLSFKTVDEFIKYVETKSNETSNK